MTRFIDSADDMKWLAEVHTPLAAAHVCAIIQGNEDMPDKIMLYKRNHVDCKPTVLELQDDYTYKVTQQGE
jgi:hypothetical protein